MFYIAAQSDGSETERWNWINDRPSTAHTDNAILDTTDHAFLLEMDFSSPRDD